MDHVDAAMHGTPRFQTPVNCDSHFTISESVEYDLWNSTIETMHHFVCDTIEEDDIQYTSSDLQLGEDIAGPSFPSTGHGSNPNQMTLIQQPHDRTHPFSENADSSPDIFIPPQSDYFHARETSHYPRIAWNEPITAQTSGSDHQHSFTKRTMTMSQ